jgi:hypothetical protein
MHSESIPLEHAQKEIRCLPPIGHKWNYSGVGRLGALYATYSCVLRMPHWRSLALCTVYRNMIINWNTRCYLFHYHWYLRLPGGILWRRFWDNRQRLNWSWCQFLSASMTWQGPVVMWHCCKPFICCSKVLITRAWFGNQHRLMMWLLSYQNRAGGDFFSYELFVPFVKTFFAKM